MNLFKKFIIYENLEMKIQFFLKSNILSNFYGFSQANVSKIENNDLKS